MLYLDTRVHLDEVVVAFVVEEELYRTCSAVVYRMSDLQSIIADVLSLLFRKAKRRCELDYLLISSLYRAVSLVEVYDVAVFVSEDLYFDVLRFVEVFLDEYIVDAESLLGFALSAVELFYESLRRVDDPHASSAAAGSSLQHYRISRLLSELNGFFF